VSPRFAIAAPAAWSGVLEAVRLEPWLPAVVLGWLCGVAVLTLRLLSGCLWVRRLKSHGTVPAAEGWQHTAARLSRRLHITRRIRLFESALVDVPTVIGWIKPVVLLPASALAGLSPQQIEAILMHELAHIRRHDYVVNLLQTLVETLLFYHPAVWWLSRRIRAERENCCDDLAVRLCGDPFAYAAALADLEELRGGTRHGEFLAMAASGGAGSSLVHRVRRLLGAPTHAGRAPGWLAGSATILLLVGVMAGAAGTDAFQSLQSSTPPQGASAPPQAASPKPPAEPLSPQELVATTRALEASAKALARELKFSWDAVLDGARRNKAHAEMEQRARHLAAAVAELQASTTGRALQDRARALAERAQTPQVAALADASRALLAIDAATTAMATQSEALLAAAVRAQSDALSAATTAAVASSAGFHTGGVQKSGNFSWSNNGEKLEARYEGDVEFTDDDTDVKWMSPGGSLRIKDGGFGSAMVGGRTVEFTADGSGTITRRFWTGMSEKPFEPEGRQWLAQVMPRFIRQTGIGAPARVARILKTQGVSGVLAEISRIEGSWAKRTYFAELLKTASLDSTAVRQVLAQAGREVDSDFELASLLIGSADKLLMDDGARQAYFEAARSIGSDFEMRRVYSSALKRGPVFSPVLAGILAASQNIDSDFELASLLLQIVKLQALDNTTRGPFFSALDTVGSDFEHRRVLSALAQRADLTPETAAAMLASSAAIDSDFEVGAFLLQIVKQHPIEGTLRAPFFRALDSIGSAFERGRVLQQVVRRADASDETVLAALRATAGMSSGFEAGQVLLAVAAAHPLRGAARDAYIDAAEKLGDFEQGRVLSALVRNERRK
jgi:beta-lactamase regulating signal transducer with metallopeptidase domain